MKCLCADIGSTFTKACLIDLSEGKILGTSQAPTTASKDITIGLTNALDKLRESCDLSNLRYKLACSSAYGGLRVVAVGLVKEYTVEAARMAALGAGANVVDAFSYGLSREDLDKIEHEAPDIVLFAGGTDGGNKEIAIHNAKILASSDLNAVVTVACNKLVRDEVVSILKESGKESRVTQNVMPTINTINIEPAKSLIREIFLEKIVKAKGIRKAEKLMNTIMPTPAAVLHATDLLAKGTVDERGVGDILVVEVGGATVNVYSACPWAAMEPGVIVKGLQEPYLKRTVEGDLGIKYNAPSILSAAGKEKLLRNVGIPNLDLERVALDLSRNVTRLPTSPEEFRIDQGFAKTAVEIAVERHCGRIEAEYTPMGRICVQYGKDLTKIEKIIATGGVISHSLTPESILAGALFSDDQPNILKPKRPNLYIDKNYILYAVGLLSTINPTRSLRLAKRYIRRGKCSER